MSRFFNSKFTLTCLVLLVLVGAVSVSFLFKTQQVSAASGYTWNYISLPTWQGNCPAGGSVKFLQIMVGDSWSGGDAGDDLVYAKVVLNKDQTVVGHGLCYNGKRSYWGPALYQTIHPTRSNQTWWIGPYGVKHN